MANLPPSAILRNYIVRSNHDIAAGIFELTLENTDSEPIPPFKAGQWVGLHLFNQDGTEWARAAYSIASAPSDGVMTVRLGIKVERDFTKRAATLKPGDHVQLQGPFGVFTPSVDAPRLVMFAGGIGITPFLSMIREITATGRTQEVILFYSCKTNDGAAYLDELQAIAAKHSNVTLVCTCTRGTDASWRGETSRIDAGLMDRFISDYSVGQYLLCGPREFMDTITEILHHKGVQKPHIKRELFS